MKFFKNAQKLLSKSLSVLGFMVLVAVILSQRLLAAFFEKALVESLPQAWEYAWSTFWGNLNIPRVLAAMLASLAALPVVAVLKKLRSSEKGGKKA